MEKIQTHRNPSLGFGLTEEDEERIRQACIDAIQYMATYGKGREPMLLDHRYYYTNTDLRQDVPNEEQTEQKKSKKTRKSKKH